MYIPAYFSVFTLTWRYPVAVKDIRRRIVVIDVTLRIILMLITWGDVGCYIIHEYGGW